MFSQIISYSKQRKRRPQSENKILLKIEWLPSTSHSKWTFFLALLFFESFQQSGSQRYRFWLQCKMYQGNSLHLRGHKSVQRQYNNKAAFELRLEILVHTEGKQQLFLRLATSPSLHSLGDYKTINKALLTLLRHICNSLSRFTVTLK